VHAVIQTPTFLADGKAAGLDDDDLEDIAALIGRDPKEGEVIVGTGGARKVRVRGKGRGKSGGFRVITFYAADDVPVFLLALISKARRADISQAERNELRRILGTLADEYRKGVGEKLKKMHRTSP
jgi:hypothetical protein